MTNNDIIKNITIRDILKRDMIFQQKSKFEKRGKNEVEMLNKTNAIIGRTTWDYANTRYINLKRRYYQSNEILRSEFYKYEWNVENIEKHTIFCSQASYPIKGLHYLIEAIYLLKKEYQDVKLYIAGPNILDTSNLKSRIKRTGYAKYIGNLIKKYQLEEQIIFTGLLSEKEMINKLLKMHVFVLPSAIENSSNSLGEAMLLGMPCVASNTGGTMDILEHEKEGYIYPYTEPAMCANYISKIFEDKELVKKIGRNARLIARERHDPEKNVKQIIRIYEDTIKNENRENNK